MKTLRDFSCSTCGIISEKFISIGIENIECPECKNTAIQLIGMPTVRLEGITGDFPGAHSKWARIREENARIKGKRDS